MTVSSKLDSGNSLCPVGTQTRTRSNRKYTTKSPHTRNGRQSSMCHNCSINNYTLITPDDLKINAMFEEIAICWTLNHSFRAKRGLYSDSSEVCMASLRVSKTSFLIGTRILPWLSRLVQVYQTYVDYKSTV